MGHIDCQKTLYESKNPTRRWLHRSRFDWVSGQIGAYGRKDRAALEIGIGSGVYLPVLAQAFGKVVAADIDDQYLEQAGRLGADLPNLSVCRDDIRNTRLPTGDFDFILMSEVLEHISDEQTVLTNVAGLLKEDGVLVLTTPQKFSLLELTGKIALSWPFIALTRWIYGEAVQPLGHINLQTESSLRRALERSGLHVVEHQKAGFYVPILAELGGKLGQSVLARMQGRLVDTWLDFLLWTQYYVAVPHPRGRNGNDPARGEDEAT